MGQAEARDVVDDEGERAVYGLLAIAGAALTASGVTPALRQFAQAVVKQGEIDLAAAGCRAPAETASLADDFNRLMDVPIDAANASVRARDRMTRRIGMAKALEDAGLILIEKHFLAGLVADRISLEMTQASIGLLTEAPLMTYRERDDRAAPSDLIVIGGDGGAFAAEMAAAGGAQHLDYLDGGPEQPDPGVND